MALGDNDDDGKELDNGVVRAGYKPECLLGYLEDGRRLDLERYKSQMFDASHVGAVFIEGKGEGEGEDCGEIVGKVGDGEAVALSVLIPVWTGLTDAASHAVMSMLYQPIEERALEE